jgi:hypothetical protein
MLPLASLDVIPPEISTDIIFEFSDDQDEPYNQRLDEMGYGNHNAIENIGSVVYFIAFTILLMIMSLILSLRIFNCKCCEKIRTKLRFFGLLATLYMIYFEGFLEILISGYLSKEGAVCINFDDKFAYTLSIIFLIILFTVVPITQIFVLCKPADEHISPEFAENYEEIYPKIDLRHRAALGY